MNINYCVNFCTSRYDFEEKGKLTIFLRNLDMILSEISFKIHTSYNSASKGTILYDKKTDEKED